MKQSRRKPNDISNRSERGYALIALIGIILFAMILTTAAAPVLKKELQREKEEEMFWRGQQVQMAIARFFADTGKFPTNLKKNLVDGEMEGGLRIGPPGKKIRYLRLSALCDPLNPCPSEEGNWNLVHLGDREPADLRDALLAYLQKQKLPPTIPPLLATAAEMGKNRLPGADGEKPGEISDDSSSSSDGLKGKPIVGVTSKTNDKMFRSYYGIEEYNKALFFPQVPVITGGIIPPIGMGATFAPTNVANPRCPDGGVRINGQCFGGLRPGQLCRGPNGESVPCPGR